MRVGRILWCMREISRELGVSSEEARHFWRRKSAPVPEGLDPTAGNGLVLWNGAGLGVGEYSMYEI